MNEDCEWIQDDWGGCSTWETTCGKSFTFEDGGPKSNGFAFCGFCGKHLAEVYTSTEQRKRLGLAR